MFPPFPSFHSHSFPFAISYFLLFVFAENRPPPLKLDTGANFSVFRNLVVANVVVFLINKVRKSKQMCFPEILRNIFC